MNPVFLYSQYRKYVIHNIDYNRLFEKNMNFSFKNTDSRVTIQKLSKIHFLNRIYLYKDKINYYYYYTNKKVRLFNSFNKNNIFDFFSSNFFTKNLYLPYKANEKNRHQAPPHRAQPPFAHWPSASFHNRPRGLR